MAYVGSYLSSYFLVLFFFSSSFSLFDIRIFINAMRHLDELSNGWNYEAIIFTSDARME